MIAAMVSPSFAILILYAQFSQPSSGIPQPERDTVVVEVVAAEVDHAGALSLQITVRNKGDSMAYVHQATPKIYIYRRSLAVAFGDTDNKGGFELSTRVLPSDVARESIEGIASGKSISKTIRIEPQPGWATSCVKMKLIYAEDPGDFKLGNRRRLKSLKRLVLWERE